MDNEIKIGIELETKGQDQAELAKNTLKDVKDIAEQGTAATVGQITQTGEAAKRTVTDFAKATTEAADATKKDSDVTSELELNKREMLESLRGITREYPILGEAARAAFNPIVFSIAGVIEAVNLWMERMQAAQELLGGWELPDLTVHAAGVTSAAEAWAKLKTAVADADIEFNSSANIFERQSKAISAQLSDTNQLIDAQKKLAEAQLDFQKAAGQITPEQYDARKAVLEAKTEEEKFNAETNARNQQIAAKKQEAIGLKTEAQNELKKANNIQPGLNDQGLQDLIDKAQDAAVEAQKKAGEFRAEAKHATEVGERAEGGHGLTGLADVAQNIPGDVAFFAKYGLTANPEDVAKLNREQAKNAEETQSGLEIEIAQLKKQKEERDKHRNKADDLAAQAEKATGEFNEENDPNVVGSLASQNAQAAIRFRINQAATQKEGDAKIAGQFEEDVKAIEAFSRSRNPSEELAKRALKAANDMMRMQRETLEVIRIIPDFQSGMNEMWREIETLRAQVGHAGSQHAPGW